MDSIPQTGRLGALLLLAFLSAALCGTAAFAQQAPAQEAAADGRIHLDVVVSPKSGPPLGDLQQQDFTVLDNKSPQTIASFKTVSGRDAQMAVVVVLDAVNAGYQTVSFERNQVEKYLHSEGGHLADPFALAVFTDKGTQIVGNFSGDGNALSAELDKDDVGIRAIQRSAGFYGASERWQLSMSALRQLATSVAAIPGRKIILWISPGWPLLSGPGVELTSKQQEALFAEAVSISTLLRQADVTLFSIDPLGTGEPLTRSSYYLEFVKGVSKPSQMSMGNLGLQVLAIQSGGIALDYGNDLTAQMQKCLAALAPYYEISFQPPPGDKPNEYHQLQIKIAKPGLTARTRQGYYSLPTPQK